jgi:hypothetical protein
MKEVEVGMAGEAGGATSPPRVCFFFFRLCLSSFSPGHVHIDIDSLTG